MTMQANTAQKKILVVEDDTMMLTLLEFKLAEQGYQITTALDGNHAKELILASDYDLIISDIMMPFLSGLELSTLIRFELNKKTPIILLSASGQETTVVEAFDKGADDFISKPFSPIELIVRVKRLLR